MENYLSGINSTDRYDDGVTVDYSFMIQMWSTFDRSIAKFNRDCGLPPIARPAREEAESLSRNRSGR